MVNLNWFLRLKSVFTNAETETESVLRTLADKLEAKDPYTLGHADRVSQYAVELGKILGVNGRELAML